MGSPKVTVLMSVYNGEKYLKEAIESILNQTFCDFEFIIINDGSTDGTASILARYQQMDDRVRVDHQQNQGVSASHNRGCHLTTGKYIAVMDADDVSLPDRLARQVHHMEMHPEIGVLGTWIEVIDEDSRPVGNRRLPTEPGVIGWYLLFANCIAHSSVMMRRDVIEPLGFYSVEFIATEDYDLWSRASIVTKIANIPEILVRYRAWKGGISSRQFQAKGQYTVKIMHSMIARLLGYDVPLETVASLRRVRTGLPLAKPQQIDEVATLVKQLHRAYLNTTSLNRAESREVDQDAGMKLLGLAASNSEISLAERFHILAQAGGLSPRLFWSKRVIMKVLEKGFRMLSGIAYGRNRNKRKRNNSNL